jgi:hypothetical protein
VVSQSGRNSANSCEDEATTLLGPLDDAPKSSLRAGLPGPDRSSWKCDGANLPRVEDDNGLFMVLSGEKTPSCARIRRLVGLKMFGAPGDRGRLLGLEDVVVVGSGKNCSRGSSRRGPGRCGTVVIVYVRDSVWSVNRGE